MKVVILASGKGTRMKELTKNTPKPLLSLHNKTILEHKIDALPDIFDEVIIVVGHLGEKIRNHFGSQFGDIYNGKKITYVESEPLGTAYSLWQAKGHLNDQFVVMNGDDFYSRKDILECLKHPHAALLFKTKEPRSGGKIILNSENRIENIIEGSHEAGATIATGLYVLTPTIFELPLKEIGNGRTEFGLPQTLLQLKDNEKLHAVYATNWHQATAPEDLEISMEDLQKFQD